MELKHYVQAVLKWWWLVALSTLVATAFSYWGTTQMPRLYRTDTTMMVGRFIESNDPSSSDIYTSQQLATSYVQLIKRQPVLQGVIDALGLNTTPAALGGQVSASVIPQTQLIQISVVDTSPERAAAIANEIAHQLILQSPTTPEKQLAEQREFVGQQLQELKDKMDEAKKQSAQLEKRLAIETSARAIQDTQTQIGALQQKITTWQSSYATLLNFFKGSQTNSLSVVEAAPITTTPVSPNVFQNVFLAALVGFLLAVGAAILLEYLDNTLKSSEDVERVVHVPTLANIGRFQGAPNPTDNLIALNEPRSMITEAYRMLRTNLQFTMLDQTEPRILVTSALPGEGKTTTAANLAIATAQTGRKVILLDTDLRRPSLHKLFGIQNRIGLTNLLLDDNLALESALAETPVAGLLVLPSGPLPPNPAELVGSKAMQRRVAELQKMADILVFDSPPVLAVADATILGSMTSGVVLVVDAGRTRADAVERAKAILDQVQLRVVGVVLNKLRSRRGAGGYYHYYYYYSQGGDKHRRRGSRSGSGGTLGAGGRPPTPADATEAGDGGE
ncbi:MAG: polysaccharide biosynthesis tyrosine autokinase [Anaerolineae bacterium]